MQNNAGVKEIKNTVGMKILAQQMYLGLEIYKIYQKKN